eukprot:TRINITY_DN15712_c0_g1::TRINITY_DN15712_c0_g1_i1::g.18693::m.18693 TRINITY_DN15712_c0_g1::TRINITY_DN15712_c0_g1_i1::g.18693  ORF type:complete len:318 (-),score=8.98,sp/Q8IX29/FBX16_HUMAN/39.33/3e-07,F-box-like/PF12937.2/7.5e-14,F-box-like/PF12937.2/2.1e+03,F-box/PF00646.28/1.1e-08,F-box/PF00646.28/2e+03,SPOC/PF07744.8/3.6e+03,SPOC/PF07744.8/0.018,PRANC/PF09372.5/0.16 TRINITY_DN15712_c0_g1_i1:622-1575(-)
MRPKRRLDFEELTDSSTFKSRRHPSSDSLSSFEASPFSRRGSLGMPSSKSISNPTTPAMFIEQLKSFIQYVESKPTLLHQSSTSFVKDHLRTLSQGFPDDTTSDKNATSFSLLPDELILHIFSFLPDPDMARCTQICHHWKRLAVDDSIWKVRCQRRWRVMFSDPKHWPVFASAIPKDQEYYKMYLEVAKFKSWHCSLHKTGRFVCKLQALHIKGPPPRSFPNELVVERRFNLSHLSSFIAPSSTVIYFEPEEAGDQEGYDSFIEYLLQRHRAGLAMQTEVRIIFIPPCEYSSETLGYSGRGLIGIIQGHYPPLVAF